MRRWSQIALGEHSGQPRRGSTWGCGRGWCLPARLMELRICPQEAPKRFPNAPKSSPRGP
eukprot:553419-Pyramimonas_sp.AAC.1